MLWYFFGNDDPQTSSKLAILPTYPKDYTKKIDNR